MGKSSWEEYMDEDIVVTGANGQGTRKRRSIFFYPWEDTSTTAVRRFVHEQQRISDNVCKECPHCGSKQYRDMRVFDDRTGRRHVFSHCADCRKYIGYESNMPNPDNNMPFGIYRGKAIRDIIDFDPSYVRWFIKNSLEGDPDREKIIETMEVAMDEKDNKYEKRPYVIPTASFLKKLEEEALRNT